MRRFMSLLAAVAVFGAVVGVGGVAEARAASPKPCKTTGTFVKPNGKLAKNSGRENPGKLFKGRAGQEDSDQERNIGETANLGGYTVTVVGAEFVPALSSFEDDGYMKVVVKVCSRDDGTQSQFPYVDWELLSPAGSQDGPTISSAPTLEKSDLVKGGEVAGDVYFEVGQNKGDYYVIFKPSGEPFEDSRGIWKVTI